MNTIGITSNGNAVIRKIIRYVAHQRAKTEEQRHYKSLAQQVLDGAFDWLFYPRLPVINKVLLELAAQLGNGNYQLLDLNAMATKLQLSHPNLCRALRRLEKEGYLIKQRVGKNSHYKLKKRKK